MGGILRMKPFNRVLHQTFYRSVVVGPKAVALHACRLSPSEARERISPQFMGLAGPSPGPKPDPQSPSFFALAFISASLWAARSHVLRG